MWRSSPKIERHTVALERLPPALDGLRVVQLSDLHVGFWCRANRVRHGVSLANALEPDLALLTGDFVSLGSLRLLAEAAPALASLHARLGVFACLGNHDHWEGGEEVRGVLEHAGVPVLVNECLEVASGLWVAAVDDLMSGSPDLERTIDGLDEKAAVIPLSHSPTVLPQVSDKPWLVLSGHTHGCQFGLPFLGPRKTASLPGIRWLARTYEALGPRRRGGRLEAVCSDRYPAGWYEEGRARMYVSRGFGANQAWPFRVGCPAEIACFELRCGTGQRHVREPRRQELPA